LSTAGDLQFHYVLTCPCGATLTGDTEDDIVEASFAHLREKHPEMADNYEREHVLYMARRLVKPSERTNIEESV
jgi:hypothetical protein